MLAEDTIEAGTDVSLNVRERRLMVSRCANGCGAVLVQEFSLASEDAALDFYAYLSQYPERFASIRIL